MAERRLKREHGLFDYAGIKPGPTKGVEKAKGKVKTNIADIAARRKAKLAEDIKKAENLLKRAGMAPEQASQIADQLRKQQPPLNDWTFVMISPAQNAAVVAWISKNSKRPQQAMLLWAHLFEKLRNDTGEIMATRAELAQKLGIEPQNLSRIMSELASINAIRADREFRNVRYFMNSNIATHLPSAKAREAARTEDGPLLKLMQGGAV